MSLSITWILIALVTSLLTFNTTGFIYDSKKTIENRSILFKLSGLIVLGLFFFVLLGVTKNFHAVKYPLLFVLVTPGVEEILFRGWIYNKLSMLKLNAVVFSALFFGLHHIQYFGYQLSLFALFQIMYTFILGLLFGFMRKKSGSIYPSLLAHILINFVSMRF